MLEKLQEFRDHDVEGPVESITIQKLRGVFTDLLQGSKGSLSREMDGAESYSRLWSLLGPGQVLPVTYLTGVIIL